MRKKSGFSIVEMLVILAILSVIVVLTLRVGESVTANSRISGLVNNFLADFSAAKLLASAENRQVAVTFSADGRSYTLQKQTDITSTLAWTLVKTVTPFSDRPFFNVADVSDFAINSTGEVRSFPLPVPPNPLGTPTGFNLEFFIRRGRGAATDPVAYRRTIRIFPYGGLKVEKH